MQINGRHAENISEQRAERLLGEERGDWFDEGQQHGDDAEKSSAHMRQGVFSVRKLYLRGQDIHRGTGVHEHGKCCGRDLVSGHKEQSELNEVKTSYVHELSVRPLLHARQSRLL